MREIQGSFVGFPAQPAVQMIQNSEFRPRGRCSGLHTVEPDLDGGIAVPCLECQALAIFSALKVRLVAMSCKLACLLVAPRTCRESAIREVI
jgi:hypothetical protein